MKLLADQQLVHYVTGDKPLVKNLPVSKDWFSADSSIQPCSIDLHVGEISIPAKLSRKSSSQQQRPAPRVETEYILAPGQTAVVTTLEELDMRSNIAAIGFPPSRVSSQGILITNPGHVDPGYKGPMHLTVINMARDSYVLRKRDMIATVLFFELDEKEVAADWAARTGGRTGGMSPENVSRLAPDFLDVEARAERIARQVTNRKITFATVVGTIVLAVLQILGQAVPHYLEGADEIKRNQAVMDEKMKELDRRLALVETSAQKTQQLTTSNPTLGAQQKGKIKP